MLVCRQIQPACMSVFCLYVFLTRNAFSLMTLKACLTWRCCDPCSTNGSPEFSSSLMSKCKHLWERHTIAHVQTMVDVERLSKAILCKCVHVQLRGDCMPIPLNVLIVCMSAFMYVCAYTCTYVCTCPCLQMSIIWLSYLKPLRHKSFNWVFKLPEPRSPERYKQINHVKTC